MVPGVPSTGFPGYNLSPICKSEPNLAPTTMPMPVQHNELPYTHFALIYLDANGNLCLQSSQSIANRCQTILPPRATEAFLRAVALSREAHSPPFHIDPSTPVSPGEKRHFPLQMPRISNVGVDVRNGSHMWKQVESGNPFQPTEWSSYQEPWPLWHAEAHDLRKTDCLNKDHSEVRGTTSMISVSDADLLGLYYKKAFENLHQTNCRVLAKAYVKLVEPRKQVNYPYNGRKTVAGTSIQLDPDVTKPPWWPSGVSHREPDHLPKVERIRLLVYILRELRTSYGISAAKLREADQPIRHQISPPERLRILNEIYLVREAEENFLEGKTDGQSMVRISRANLPETEGDTPSPKGRSGNSSPTEMATIRDPNTNAGTEPRVVAVDALQPVIASAGGFATNSYSNRHPLPGTVSESTPTVPTAQTQSSFDSAGSLLAVPGNPRNYDGIETYSVDPTSPTSLWHCPSICPVGPQQLPIKYYDDHYHY
ncbi:hypothetical protein N7474_006804 [Penicillium riverlandense]|uniref:uncharacterized protein n=1 Tax=Penicillium riverlandense TaxID=1903569 RepID=UPI002548D4AD|nr:uncharacterized protein N7474_006804 [Penicillium riverlandense]KAJ5815027.1 hypothetical protein N7474_006804 [Penicillium riverlandense]